MAGKRRPRFLTPEEAELWAHVTRHDEPLARPLARALNDAPDQAPEAKNSAEAAPPEAQIAPNPPAPDEVSPPKKRAAARRAPSPPPTAPFEPRVARHLARGRREIDARLDLHGLRQQDAYFALRQFLARSQAAGHRHVLIITGKGEKAGAEYERDYWMSEQRGVLRRLVPQWLSEPDFRAMVVSYAESALKHGGSGALYVTLRRRR